MNKSDHRGHCFPPAIIQLTVWMYGRFTLSPCDAEELLAERGLDVSYKEAETLTSQLRLMGENHVKRERNILKRVDDSFCRGSSPTDYYCILSFHN